MAREQSKRLSQAVIDADRSCFAALQGMTNYSPANPAFSLAAITAAQTGLSKALSDMAQAEEALAAARAEAIAKEWEFHNLILGAKDQVLALFGRDSYEVEAIGLKRRSEYKTPTRKQAGDGKQPTASK